MLNESPTVKLSSCFFDRNILDQTYKWLNDPEILALVDAQPVERQSQLAWFETLTLRRDFYIKGVCYNGKPIGVFGLKNLTTESGEYWGYIGEKHYWGQGIGKWIMDEAISLAKQLELTRIYLKVLPENERAISLYRKYHFREISNEKNEKFIVMDRYI